MGYLRSYAPTGAQSGDDFVSFLVCIMMMMVTMGYGMLVHRRLPVTLKRFVRFF